MMQDPKKAVPVLQHQDGRAETGPTFQSRPHSYSQFTTSPPLGQAVHIADFLSTGVAYAVTLRDLVALTGRNERDVRKQIEIERRHGTPILSNSKDGYWLGENQDEIARFVRGMKHRARQIQLTADAVGKAAGIGK